MAARGRNPSAAWTISRLAAVEARTCSGNHRFNGAVNSACLLVGLRSLSTACCKNAKMRTSLWP